MMKLATVLLTRCVGPTNRGQINPHERYSC